MSGRGSDPVRTSVLEAFARRNAGNNMLDRYIQRLESLQGDAVASYETVRMCDEIAEDLSARCSGLCARQTSGADEFDSEVIETEGLLMEVADTKLAVLDHCYEAVDLMVRQLDRRTRFMEALLRQQTLVVDKGLDMFAFPDKHQRSDSVSKRTRYREGDDDDATSRGARSASTGAAASAHSIPGLESLEELVSQALAGATSRQHPSTRDAPASAADSSIDPSEPVYCTCRQVAFGDMIACDNLDCAIEWFHCQCVGLARSSRPTAWYCSACTPLLKAASSPT